MPTYLHPGVYLEELQSGSKPIAGVGSSTAIFIGKTSNGSIGAPVLITKLDDYQQQFGYSESDTPVSNDMENAVTAFFFNGGSKAYIAHVDDNALISTEYAPVLKHMLKIRDINMVCLPGQVFPADGTGNTIIGAAISHCETMKNRMVIADLEQAQELENEGEVTTMSLPTSSYCAVYYPHIKASNPYGAGTVLVGASAFAAGMWAKIDSKRGVWKAPAGVETSLLGVAGLEHIVENAEQDFLNPNGINAVRSLPGYGTVIWGSRTLATNADPEWRYVPVRRTAMFIEESLSNGIQWSVFEGNNHVLWSALRTNIEAFMNSLFRSGAFQGESTGDAYFVRCGLGDTMTQADIDNGQVIIQVGFAPLKPAEFVILRLQQKIGQ